ncbi:MAG: cytochrome c3 family protein [Crocinitomicaceae bacterium]|nr:cytochrome c3 family protein [Crocinitomicaceae bacterium]MDG1657790.1 cytochrome c3 family protein [Crocinitomicaceae bacterium]
MKISSSQMFKNFNKWCLGAFAATLTLGTFSVNAQEPEAEASINGGDLFKSKCATCHHPFKDGTGPKLYDVRTAWSEGGAGAEAIYQWVNNWQTAAASDPYAAGVAQKKATAMTKFPDLTKPQIVAILDWVDSQEEKVAGAAGGAAGGAEGVEGEEEGGFSWIWIILGVLFVIVILAVSGVRRQLKAASGEAGSDTLSYGEEFKAWAWGNLRYVLIGSVVIFITLIVVLFQGLYSIGVVEGYQPSQPIDFPHSKHAGMSGIDCKYCHNSVTESRSAGLPTVNVCMNCHKQVAGNDDEQMEKIAKIYAAAGWDADAQQYTGKTTPIVWNKVHVLPDHVYFNHSQHVEVGGVDCKQCHGDMTKQQSTAMVQPVVELNKIEGNVQLTRPTLTMGWCLECHAEKEISTGSIDNAGGDYYQEIHRRLLYGDKKLYSDYLEDGKVTVMELGGWECAKCHY